MIRLILIAALIITIAAGLAFIAYPFIKSFNQKPPTQTELPAPSTSTSILDTPTITSADEAQTPISTTQPLPSPSDLTARVKALEQAVSLLQKTSAVTQPSSSPAATTTVIQPSSGPESVYIPIGNGGQTAATSWQLIPEQQVEIDSSKYPGYKDAKLVIQMRVVSALGIAYAMLVDLTDNVTISQSQVSATGSTAQTVTSPPFQLVQGKKTYGIQAWQNGGETMYISAAYIKINYN